YSMPRPRRGSLDRTRGRARGRSRASSRAVPCLSKLHRVIRPQQRPCLRRVLRGYLRGIARYKQDRELAKQVIARYTSGDDAATLDQSWALEDRVLSRVPYP